MFYVNTVNEIHHSASQYVTIHRSAKSSHLCVSSKYKQNVEGKQAHHKHIGHGQADYGSV